MEVFLNVIYYLALFIIFLFSLTQLYLMLVYVFRQRTRARSLPIVWAALPRLTIQLPVYNELYVIDRLIDAVANLHYPADKLDIQILDDSTDETTARIARKLLAYGRLGIRMEHICRPERTGFKAGALAYGLPRAKGDFIAIFDADFIPDSDFLLRALPGFDRPDIAVVQTRWLHLNEAYSLLTQIQSLGLNAHFFVEQTARSSAGLFLNFNGTAGIWRKEAILDAGGWQSDTLTEDLDLSYRAQLKGWKIIYRDDIGVPAELPVTMNAIRSQQYRWMKGPAECARKLLGSILPARNASVGKKLLAVFHLLNSSLFIVILTMALVSVPVLYLRHQYPNPAWLNALNSVSGLFIIASVVSLFFWGIPFFQNKSGQLRTGQTASDESWLRKGIRFLWLYPVFLAVMLGLSLHNSLAVIEGLLGIKTPFVRTPKFNLSATSNRWEDNVYEKPAFSWLLLGEIGLAFYFGLGVMLGLYEHDYTMLSFHSLLTVGFGLVASYTLIHGWAVHDPVAESVAVPSV